MEFSVNVGPSASPALRCAAEVGDPYLPPYPRALSALESLAELAQELGYAQAYDRIMPGISQLVSPDLPVPETTRFWVWGGLDVAPGTDQAPMQPILKIYLNLMDTELGGGGRARLEAALAAAGIPLQPGAAGRGPLSIGWTRLASHRS